MRRYFFIGLFLLAPVFASADIVPTYQNLELGMMPQYPHPGDTVTLTLVDTSGNAGATDYTWDIDGRVVLQGIGQKNLTLTAGNLGEAHTVTVTSDIGGVPQGSVSQIILPGAVDLVWEGETAVPPLFIGRPLPNAASRVRVLAVPHIIVGGKEASADSLTYTWSEDDAPLGGQSGYGRSAILVTPPRFGAAFTVSVHAETADGRGAADGSVVITPQTPRAAMYENAPLLGIRLEKNISGNFPLTEAEASFVAFPFFVSNPASLTYQWTLDATPFAVDPARPLNATLRKVGGGTGTHAVSFSFQNANNFIESGQASFMLTF